MVSDRSGCVIAVDVGGTAVKAAVVDRHGAAIARLSVPTSRDGPAGVVEQIGLIAEELTHGAHERRMTPVGLGVVVPGRIDEAAGVVALAGNLGWRDVPLRALVEKRTGLPVSLGHDVRAGGLAEFTLGASRGAGDHLFLAIGTGVAGAIMLGGEAYGGGGYAGEIGHVVVEPDGVECGCGGRGCLEMVASAGAIARRYAERSGDRVNAAEVAARAATGEAIAVAVWHEGVDALVIALAGYAFALAPELVVVGGGLAGAGEQLLAPLRDRLADRLGFQRMPTVVGAELGELAGCLGAGLLAWGAAGREVRP